MFRKRKEKKVEGQLLADLLQIQNEWMQLKKIMEQSIDSSEAGQFDLMVAEAKYFYLLREAKHYDLNAKQF